MEGLNIIYLSAMDMYGNSMKHGIGIYFTIDAKPDDIIDYLDSDGDRWNDTYENASGSDPYDPKSTPLDWDGDGVANVDDAYPDDGDRWGMKINPKGSAGWWIPGFVIAIVLFGIIAVAVVIMKKREKEKDGPEERRGNELGRVG